MLQLEGKMEKDTGTEVGGADFVERPPSGETGESNASESNESESYASESYASESYASESSGVPDVDSNTIKRKLQEEKSEPNSKRQKSEPDEQPPLLATVGTPNQVSTSRSPVVPRATPGSSVKGKRGGTSNFQNVVAFLKKCLAEEKCELYKALTFEHFEALKQHWMKVPAEKENWSWEKWTLKKDDESTWPKLTDLPPFLHADTIDPVKFHEQTPCTGKYEVLPNGLPKSYAPRPDGPCKVS